jgi:hypothetical protein
VERFEIGHLDLDKTLAEKAFLVEVAFFEEGEKEGEEKDEKKYEKKEHRRHGLEKCRDERLPRMMPRSAG